MARHLQVEWQPVSGQRVELRLGGRRVREGVVDGVTDDDSILWLAAEAGFQRELFLRADGYEVWIAYQWERPVTSPSEKTS